MESLEAYRNGSSAQTAVVPTVVVSGDHNSTVVVSGDHPGTFIASAITARIEAIPSFRPYFLIGGYENCLIFLFSCFFPFFLFSYIFARVSPMRCC